MRRELLEPVITDTSTESYQANVKLLLEISDILRKNIVQGVPIGEDTFRE
jgi:biotin synthase-related radical SAM superfamily protein